MQDIPRYYESVLQALTHWIAYKREYFYEHLLPEGAIVAELNQLFSAQFSSGLSVHCETMYKEMDESISDTSRADITIHKREGDFLVLQDVIEVKRYESAADFKCVIEDSKKLYRLEKRSIDARLFQIVVGQRRVPAKFVTDSHNVLQKNICPDSEGIERLDVRARMCKKAYGTKRPSVSGAFAVLLEVCP